MKFLILLNIIAIIFTRRMRNNQCVKVIQNTGYELLIEGHGDWKITKDGKTHTLCHIPNKTNFKFDLYGEIEKDGELLLPHILSCEYLTTDKKLKCHLKDDKAVPFIIKDGTTVEVS
jgi:hypothetical protein